MYVVTHFPFQPLGAKLPLLSWVTLGFDILPIIPARMLCVSVLSECTG